MDTGSFGSATNGISPALRAAMAQRQGQGGVTQQTTNGAPGAQPMPTPQGSPQIIQQSPQQVQKPIKGSTPDSAVILGAMNERMKSENKIAEFKAGIPSKMPTTGGM